MTRAVPPSGPTIGILTVSSLLSVFLIGLLLFLPAADAVAEAPPDEQPDAPDHPPEAPPRPPPDVEDPTPTIGLVLSVLASTAALLWVRRL